jgi:hypothetical protein
VYSARDIEKYKEVLLKPDDNREKFKGGYLWKNQVLQQDSLGLSYDYAADCMGTEWILDNAETMSMKLYPSAISSGTWHKVEEEILGDLCEDCWSIQKNYKFGISFNNGSHFQGDDEVLFTIGPDPDGSGKYVIYRADDLEVH